MEGHVWEVKTHHRSLFLPGEGKKKEYMRFFMHIPPVCRHILVSEIKQSREHMF